MSNDQSLEVVSRSSETQVQVGKNLITAGNGLLLTHRLPTLALQ